MWTWTWRRQRKVPENKAQACAQKLDDKDPLSDVGYFLAGIVSNLDISKLHKNTLSQPKSVGKIFLFFELN